MTASNYVYTNLNTADWLNGVAAFRSHSGRAVGDNAAIYTTTNGAQWTLRGTPPGVGSDWLLAGHG